MHVTHTSYYFLVPGSSEMRDSDVCDDVIDEPLV